MEPNELDNEPCYVISVATRLVGVHAQTLRYYERAGLVEPFRSKGNVRIYSPRDIQHIRLIKRLIDDLGVNLAGVEVILRLLGQIGELEGAMQRLRGENQHLHRRARSQQQGVRNPTRADTPSV